MNWTTLLILIGIVGILAEGFIALINDQKRILKIVLRIVVALAAIIGLVFSGIQKKEEDKRNDKKLIAQII